MNLHELFQASKDAEDVVEYKEDVRLTHEEAPSGTELRTEVAWAGTKVSKNTGSTGYVTKFRVLDGEHKDKVIWDTVWFSNRPGKGPLGYNKRMFAKLRGAGITEQFLSSNPSSEAVANAMKGQKVLVTLKWEDPDDQGRVFLSNNTTWKSLDTSAPAGYVPGAKPKGF